MAAFAPLMVPFPVFMLAPASYSISYDNIYKRRNAKDAAPNGWNSPRSNIYRRMKRHLLLNGFARDQYSDWIQLFTTPTHTYNTMVDLEFILSPNEFSSTVRRLRMNRLDLLWLMDVTDITLGGIFVNTLRGPVPANLVLPVAGAPPGPVPPGFFVRPVDSRPGPGCNPANFLM